MANAWNTWVRGLSAGVLVALALWGCAGQGDSASGLGTPVTEAQRCVDGGGTWDTGNTRVPPYCAKGTAAQCTASGGHWQRNGASLTNATGLTLTLPDVQPPTAGLYTYTATAPGGGIMPLSNTTMELTAAAILVPTVLVALLLVRRTRMA